MGWAGVEEYSSEREGGKLFDWLNEGTVHEGKMET